MVQSRTNDKLRSDRSHKSKLRIQEGTVKPSAMALVIKYLLLQPHTSASLVQKIRVYSPSHINSCLRKLRKAKLIDAVWNSKQVSLVYYNLNLEKVESLD
jgi:hypothetical protein